MTTQARRRTVDVIDRRVGLLFGLFLLLLLVAVVRAAYLGTFRSGALKAAAAEEHVDNITVPAIRGAITDRNGVVLALSVAADQVVADPLLIKHPDKVAAKLAPLVGGSAAHVARELTEPNTQYVVLNSDVPAVTANKIIKLGVNGINDLPIENRIYPRDSEAAQLLGWVPTCKSICGSGLELEYNKLLAGASGERRVINDALGKPIQVNTLKPMQPGKALQLTISAPLQSYVEQVLAGVGSEFKPLGATAIVTDPQTDQILALANWPSYNANAISAADLKTTATQTAAVEDQAVDFTYEPGSTFKAVTVSGALQDGLVTPDTVFPVPPFLEQDGYKISDAEPHGEVDYSVKQILKYSSNIGADLIGQRLGSQRFSQWVNSFGFGKPTGVPLPGEGQGIITPLSKYTGVSMYNLPFGQGESVTPMQMVQAYDAVADGGVLRTPQVVQSIGGKKAAEPTGHRIISAQVASEVRYMLRGVLADGGTASGAKIPGYDLAGKTGTSQVAIKGGYSKTEFVASFIGMVPTSDPKLVVAVVVDQPQGVIYGGSVAAPAFQKIVGWAVPYFGINPCPVAVPGVCH